jgi:uncharacterized protein (TIGR00251 family)
MACFEATADGLIVAVRVTPRGGRDAIDGVRTDAAGRARLAIRVSAAAEDGAANRAACAVLAKALGVAKGAVTLRSGATAREKRLMVSGEPARLTALLKGVTT